MITTATAKPQQKLSQMYYDLTRAKNLLMQVRELPSFQEVFTPGEVESLTQMVKRIETKHKAIVMLQEVM